MFRRFAPLRVRLPMTVALLLAVCTGAVIVTAYRDVRQSVTESAGVRFRGAGERIAVLLETSARRAQIESQRIAALPAVAAWLRGGSPAEAVSRLDSVNRAGAQHGVVLLVRRTGERIVSGDTALLGTALAAKYGIGPFFRRDSSAGYTFAGPLLVNRDTVGSFAAVRIMTPGASNADALGALVGKDAAFRIGNADGSLWTDFERPVRAPVEAERARDAAKSGQAIVGDTIAAVLRVAGTPWMLWVGQPAAIAEQPATMLGRRLVLLAIVATLIGAALAWWAIRRFTEPLEELALASDAIARGDYDRRIADTTAGDEVARAAIAFNSMAGTIATHYKELERLVNQRTAALKRAIADLRAAQEENVRKERLAVLGQLAGGVGHELRNPLGVMTNSLYVLETIIQNPDAMVRDYLGILRNQIALSEKIISDLLDFARTKPANRAPVALESIARLQLERLGPSTVPVEWDIPPSLPMVDVDSVQVGQVVLNLITNAVQAMAGRAGGIKLRGFRDDNGCAVLEVRDCGPGIPDDVATRIFEPLFTTKAKGLGLGLSVSRMLAENNNGRLWFETKPGSGAAFFLALPVAAYE